MKQWSTYTDFNSKRRLDCLSPHTALKRPVSGRVSSTRVTRHSLLVLNTLDPFRLVCTVPLYSPHIDCSASFGPCGHCRGLYTARRTRYLAAQWAYMHDLKRRLSTDSALCHTDCPTNPGTRQRRREVFHSLSVIGQ